jgi:hypothetical protein
MEELFQLVGELALATHNERKRVMKDGISFPSRDSLCFVKLPPIVISFYCFANVKSDFTVTPLTLRLICLLRRLFIQPQICKLPRV